MRCSWVSWERWSVEGTTCMRGWYHVVLLSVEVNPLFIPWKGIVVKNEGISFLSDNQ